MAEAKYKSPRAWMTWYFNKNAASLERDASKPDDLGVDWEHPDVLAGDLCLADVDRAIAAFAAGAPDTGEGLLDRTHHMATEGWTRLANATERDEIDLTRVDIVLTHRIGAVLAPERFTERWEVPFEAFPRYLKAKGSDLEVRNAVRVLWALLAVFEEGFEEWGAAMGFKLRAVASLRGEAELVPALARLCRTADDPLWADYERVLARWLNPVLLNIGVVALLRFQLATLLSLVWCKYHLGRLDRDTLLSTYFGETVSVPVVVAECPP